MQAGIKNRLEALEARAEAFTEQQDPDPLSKSLYEFGDELSQLDEFEKFLQAEEMEITPGDIDTMLKAFKRKYLKRRF